MRKLGSLLLVSMMLACGLVLAQTPVPEGPEAEAATLEEYLKLLRGDLEAKRDSAMSALLEMSADEAKVFQPIKRAYDEELHALGKRRAELMEEYMLHAERLTPEKATELGERSFKIDMDRMTLRKKYFDKMSKEVSPVVAVQFAQLERQFETMGDLKVATRMPLAVR